MSDYLCLPVPRSKSPARRFWQHEYFILLLLLLAGAGLIAALFWQIGTFHDPSPAQPYLHEPTTVIPKL